MARPKAKERWYGDFVYDVAAVRRWTRAAFECYQRGCKCKGCYYDGFFRNSRKENGLGKNYKCRMKGTVIALVREFGIPDGDTEGWRVANSKLAKSVESDLKGEL